MSAMPRGLEGFCRRRGIDAASWAERGKLRLAIDDVSVSIDAPTADGLRLVTRLKPLPADPRDRERLVDAALTRVLGRAATSAESITLNEAGTLCVERQLTDASDEFVVARAIEDFVNAIVYWRQVTA